MLPMGKRSVLSTGVTWRHKAQGDHFTCWGSLTCASWHQPTTGKQCTFLARGVFQECCTALLHWALVSVLSETGMVL